MLIRTQDKKALINLDNISKIYILGNAIYADFNNKIYTNIGEYSTDDKALKVLDMIQKNVIKIELAKIGGLNCFEIDWIYQMPQDISDTEEITETESEEKQSLDYYKDLLFGGCDDN